MAAYDDISDYNGLMWHILYHESTQANLLGLTLYDRLHPRSVLDVGCGPGIYLLPFKAKNCTVVGIDGASGAGKYLAAADFLLVDLRGPWVSPLHFELSLCIEVGEHIAAEHAESLIKMICESSDACFWTAATPGQNGDNHINEQPKEYWVDLFGRFGFGIHPLNSEIMQVISSDPCFEVEKTQWLRKNGILMGRNP